MSDKELLERAISISQMDDPSEEWMGADDQRDYHAAVARRIAELEGEVERLEFACGDYARALETNEMYHTNILEAAQNVIECWDKQGSVDAVFVDDLEIAIKEATDAARSEGGDA